MTRTPWEKALAPITGQPGNEPLDQLAASKIGAEDSGALNYKRVFKER